MATLLSPQAPVPLQDPGVSVVNRVGVAPDAVGNPMLCYAGGQKQLALLGGVPGARRWYEWDCLALPANRTNVLLIETVGRVEEATDEYVALRNEMLAAPRQYAHLYPPTPEGEPEPFPHQVDAFAVACEAFARGFGGFGVWMEQGTGKTRLACDMIRYHCHRAAVVVVQNSTILQWKDWLERICGDFEIRLLTGCSMKARAASIDEVTRGTQMFARPVVFVLNWESLSRLQDALIRLKPEMTILDESTRAKERTSQMAKAAHRIGAASRLRIAMSGTPLGNSPGDLWSVYRFLEPELFGRSYWAFMRTYFLLGGFSGNEFTGFNPMQIGSFIGKLYSLAYRVTKSTLQNMPEKNYEVVNLKMSDQQRKLYDQLEKDLYARLVQEDGTVGTISVANALVQVTRLQQISAGLFPMDNETGERSRCVPITSVKTEWLTDYCREAMANTDVQIVVWCRFSDEIQAICRSLTLVGLTQEEEFAFIDGSVKTIDRRGYQNRFNNREDRMRILVCQIQAVALGFDLPSADEMIYHTNSYSFLDRAQSLERGHRMGRTRPYKILDLVCENSIDVKVLGSLKRKQNLADTLLVEGMGSALMNGTNVAS